MVELTDKQLARYARQLILPEIDLEGQQRLQQGRVLVVGAGGLGGPISQYLAAAGVGMVRIADDDIVELSNLPRQIAFAASDIGRPKVVALAERIACANDDVIVDACPVKFSTDTGPDLTQDVDLVIDATDSMAARLDIDEVSFSRQLPWIMGAAVRTSGQWLALDASRHHGCYHCLMTSRELQDDGGCAALGILGPVATWIAMQQCVLAMKYLLGKDLPWGVLHIANVWTGESTELSLSRRPDCTLCGSAR